MRDPPLFVVLLPTPSRARLAIMSLSRSSLTRSYTSRRLFSSSMRSSSDSTCSAITSSANASSFVLATSCLLTLVNSQQLDLVRVTLDTRDQLRLELTQLKLEVLHVPDVLPTLHGNSFGVVDSSRIATHVLLQPWIYLSTHPTPRYASDRRPRHPSSHGREPQG